MKNTKHALLMSVAAAALVAGAGFAFAQTPPSGAQIAPVEKAAPPKDVSKDKAPGGDIKSGKTDEKMEHKGAKSERAQDTPKADGKPGGIQSESKPSGKMGLESDPDSKKKVDARDSERTGEGKARTTDRNAGGDSVRLSTEQRSAFHNAIKHHNAQPMRNVDFQVTVGSRVPRHVHFYPMPDEMVRFYPNWRGYDYFLVGDEIIVVNPRTHEIVAVLPA